MNCNLGKWVQRIGNSNAHLANNQSVLSLVRWKQKLISPSVAATNRSALEVSCLPGHATPMQEIIWLPVGGERRRLHGNVFAPLLLPWCATAALAARTPRAVGEPRLHEGGSLPAMPCQLLPHNMPLPYASSRLAQPIQRPRKIAYACSLDSLSQPRTS